MDLHPSGRLRIPSARRNAWKKVGDGAFLRWILLVGTIPFFFLFRTTRKMVEGGVQLVENTVG